MAKNELEESFYRYRLNLKNKLLTEPKVHSSLYPLETQTFWSRELTHHAEYLFHILSRKAVSCVLIVENYKNLHLFDDRKISESVVRTFKKLVNGSANIIFLYRFPGGDHAACFNYTAIGDVFESGELLEWTASSHRTSLVLCKSSMQWNCPAAADDFRDEVAAIWSAYVTQVAGLCLDDYNFKLVQDNRRNNAVIFRVNNDKHQKVRVFACDEEKDIYLLLYDLDHLEPVFTLMTLIFIWMSRKNKSLLKETCARSVDENEEIIKNDPSSCSSIVTANAFLHLVARNGSNQAFQPVNLEAFVDRAVSRMVGYRPAANHQRYAVDFVRRAPGGRLIFALAQFCCWLGLFNFAFSYRNKIYYSPEFAENSDELFVFTVTSPERLFSFLEVEHRLPSKKHISTEHILKYGKELHGFWPLHLNMERPEHVLDGGLLDELVQYTDKGDQPGAVAQFVRHQGILMICDKPIVSCPYVKSRPLCGDGAIEKGLVDEIPKLHDLYTAINVTHALKRINIIAIHVLRDQSFFLKLSFGGIKHSFFLTPVDVAQCDRTLQIYNTPPDQTAVRAMTAYSIFMENMSKVEKKLEKGEKQLHYSGADQTLSAHLAHLSSRGSVRVTSMEDRFLASFTYSRSSPLPPVRYSRDAIETRSAAEKYIVEHLVSLDAKNRRSTEDKGETIDRIVSKYKLDENNVKPSLLDSRDAAVKLLLYASPFKYMVSSSRDEL